MLRDAYLLRIHQSQTSPSIAPIVDDLVIADRSVIIDELVIVIELIVMKKPIISTPRHDLHLKMPDHRLLFHFNQLDSTEIRFKILRCCSFILNLSARWA